MRKLQKVYVMSSDVGITKIGIAEDPEVRRRTIQNASGIRLKLAHYGEVRDDARQVEAMAHRLLAEKRKTGEWFDVTVQEAIDALGAAAEIVEEMRAQKVTATRLPPIAGNKGGRPRKGFEKGASAFIAVRVPEWVKEGLEAIAHDRNGPYSDVIVEALVAYLKKHGIRKAA